jgi:excinuclease ABC subunit A
MQPTRLRGARTNNLKRVDLDLAPGELVVIAGPSGAGKSSLAFGTLYAEGQRRYVESFSAYARQFLERLPRPPVDSLDPIPASVAVDRSGPVRTSRSTVGTMTEISDYAKDLWARVAVLHCASCGEHVRPDDPEAFADRLIATHANERAVITAPVSVPSAERFLGVREALIADGYGRVQIAGKTRELETVRPSEVLSAKQRASKSKKPAPKLDVVIDRLVLRETDRTRLVEAIERAYARGEGRAQVQLDEGEVVPASLGLHCARCDLAYRDPTPGMFSFNSAVGACTTCRGFGRVIGVDLQKVLPDPRRSIATGAIAPFSGKSTEWERRILKRAAALRGLDLHKPLADYTDEEMRFLVEGDERGWPKGWGGLRGWFEWLESKAYKMHVRVFLARYRSYDRCPECGGARLQPESLLHRVGTKNIAELFALPVAEAREFLVEHERAHQHDPAARLLFRECLGRLETLLDVGLGYLALDRASRTLSGGETQRVALTGALGATLTNSLFVLDEPTTGLHPEDVARLAVVARKLAKSGNTVVAIEHEASMIMAADRVVELGPGSGEAGGTIVFDGSPDALLRAHTRTAEALVAPPRMETRPRKGRGWLRLTGARGNNLGEVTLEIPIGAMTCVTGVSGSGKSSLVLETLHPAVARHLGVASSEPPLPFDALEGAEALRTVEAVDQSPLGRTSRGNPATYLKVWDHFRKRLAATDEARRRELGPGYFSLNVEGGRCEVCKGQGYETVEMQFLADVTFSCPACGGRRFTPEALEIELDGLHAAAILELTIDEALARFGGDRAVQKALAPAREVGLGYLRLGQPLNALSGGEAQRLKLAHALSGSPKDSLLIFDEPTAGLHPSEVELLLDVLSGLVDRGATVVMVEHELRAALRADHVVDLGPGAGADGGRVVASGPVAEVMKSEASVTAVHLRRALESARKLPAIPARDRADASLEAFVRVENAREHNLKNVTLSIPLERLVAIGGPSGSGKSTLAFDIVHAEGQRRFLETLSPYARQYLPQLPRPDVDRVVGVPPTVALEQRITAGGAMSTVGTLTEVAHFVRLLYARVGRVASDGAEGSMQGLASMAAKVRRKFGARGRVTVYAPVVRGRKGLHRDALEAARREGYSEARIDGRKVALKNLRELERHKEHDIDLPVARVKTSERDALLSALGRAAERAEGEVRVTGRRGTLDLRLEPDEGARQELDPRLFSHNTRQGACPRCEGEGKVHVTVRAGKRSEEEARPCPSCHGSRLGEFARSVEVNGSRIHAVLAMDVSTARAHFASLALEGRDATIAEGILRELDRRLGFLESVGLTYLGLDRGANTLSGGETQRVRLAAQLGAGLTGVLYVLDEPTIGLHSVDTHRLIEAMRALVKSGNGVLVVEHDAEVLLAADQLIDVGPGGGRRGGAILAQGAPRDLAAKGLGVTAPSLARRVEVRAPRPRAERWITLTGARGNNLRDVTAHVPEGRLTVITGVSGSGKSSLVRGTLLPAAKLALGHVAETPLPHRTLELSPGIRRAVEVDQSPIGRTPRSVPATYVGVWDDLRALLAATPEARARGYGPGRFSFNVAEGRCPTCDGNGVIIEQMAFLPDVQMKCDACGGLRFTRETLEVKLGGLSAGQILELEIDEACERFATFPKVAAPLALLRDLGLGYLSLGQRSSTLSGGEAQRLKLVAELGATSSPGTLYVLDEPTTGLHRDDVVRLIALLDRFVSRGDTVVVIEHHLDVIAAADHVVDLGPGGGRDGGSLLGEGTPREIAAIGASPTGRLLHQVFTPARTP